MPFKVLLPVIIIIIIIISIIYLCFQISKKTQPIINVIILIVPVAGFALGLGKDILKFSQSSRPVSYRLKRS